MRLIITVVKEIPGNDGTNRTPLKGLFLCLDRNRGYQNHFVIPN